MPLYWGQNFYLIFIFQTFFENYQKLSNFYRAIIMGTKPLSNLYIQIFFFLKIIANQVYGNKLSGTTDSKHLLFQINLQLAN